MLAGDLLQAKHLGEKAFQGFSEERLEANPPKVRFHDSMSKAVRKTFEHMNKKVELRKGTAKEIVLKADRALFAQVIAQYYNSRGKAIQHERRQVLSHPFDRSATLVSRSSLILSLEVFSLLKVDKPSLDDMIPRVANKQNIDTKRFLLTHDLYTTCFTNRCFHVNILQPTIA